MIRHILICTLFFSMSFSSFAASFKPESYTETELTKLKATPEEYKNKKICYTSICRGYYTTFQPYVERSGFKAGKYFGLYVVPLDLPVLVKKDDEINEIVSSLEKGTKVKVYGKLKKFTYEPEATRNPHYYLELDKIEIVKDAELDEKAKEVIKTDIEASDNEVGKDKKKDLKKIGPPKPPSE